MKRSSIQPLVPSSFKDAVAGARSSRRDEVLLENGPDGRSRPPSATKAVPEGPTSGHESRLADDHLSSRLADI
jgi:hypothetical protein